MLAKVALAGSMSYGDILFVEQESGFANTVVVPGMVLQRKSRSTIMDGGSDASI